MSAVTVRALLVVAVGAILRMQGATPSSTGTNVVSILTAATTSFMLGSSASLLSPGRSPAAACVSQCVGRKAHVDIEARKALAPPPPCPGAEPWRAAAFTSERCAAARAQEALGSGWLLWVGTSLSSTSCCPFGKLPSPKGWMLACSAAGAAPSLKAWEGGLYGFTLAEDYASGANVCTQLAYAAGGPTRSQSGEELQRPLCLRNADMFTAFRRSTRHESPVGSPQWPLWELQDALSRAYAAEDFLRGVDLVVCGYPFLICVIYGDLPATAATPLLATVKGAGATAEYLDPSLKPWILGKFGAWLSAAPGASRQLVVLDRLDVVITREALGRPPLYVPFGARHVAALAGGVRCHLRAARKEPRDAPRKLLVHKIHLALLVERDQRAFLGLLTSTHKEMAPTQWILESPSTFEYGDLQAYSAALMIPWDFALVSFLELYRLGIPIFLPADTWMHTLITIIFATRRNRQAWETIFVRRFSNLIPDNWEGFFWPGGVRPAIEEGPDRPPLLDQVVRWYNVTEYQHLPHVHRFSSFANLLEVLVSFDAEAVCLRMGRHNRVLLRGAARSYRKVLASMTGI